MRWWRRAPVANYPTTTHPQKKHGIAHKSRKKYETAKRHMQNSKKNKNTQKLQKIIKKKNRKSTKNSKIVNFCIGSTQRPPSSRKARGTSGERPGNFRGRPVRPRNHSKSKNLKNFMKILKNHHFHQKFLKFLKNLRIASIFS